MDLCFADFFRITFYFSAGGSAGLLALLCVWRSRRSSGPFQIVYIAHDNGTVRKLTINIEDMACHMPKKSVLNEASEL